MRIPIRAKVGLAVLVPVVALVGLGASEAASSDRTDALGLWAAALVAGLLFAILAARLVGRPVRALARQADEVAGRVLPAAIHAITNPQPEGPVPDIRPVTVKARDETVSIAASFNQIRAAAVDQASQHAWLGRSIDESLAHLGRRNHHLLRRQTELIAALERAETDPEPLEQLRALAQATSRARRNAESLLVLTGPAPGLQWSEPVRIAHVIQAAVDGIEHAHRVKIHPIGEAQVLGRAVPDLIHLLSELIENALSFSAWDRLVDIHGRMTLNGYVVAVIDQGMGMGEEDLARANLRLAGGEPRSVALPSNIGLLVAGTLARRIGVTVGLSGSPACGVAAQVVVPAGVLDGTPALPSVPSASVPEPPARVVTVDHAAPVAPVAPVAPLAPVIPIDASFRRPAPAASDVPVAPAIGAVPRFSAAVPAVPLTPAVPVAFRPPAAVGPPTVVAPPGPAAPADWRPARFTSDGLQRRVRGAQLPGGRRPGEGRHGSVRPVPGIHPPPGSADADEMFSLLNGLASRLERGLDELEMASPETVDVGADDTGA